MRLDVCMQQQQRQQRRPEKKNDLGPIVLFPMAKRPTVVSPPRAFPVHCEPVPDLISLIAQSYLPGIFVLPDSGCCYRFVHNEDDLRQPTRLAVNTRAHPSRVFVEKSRGVDRMAVNEWSETLLGVPMRGPFCVLPPLPPPPCRRGS